MKCTGWLRALRPERRNTPARRRSWAPRVELLEGRLVPTLLGNRLFPADNPWNEQISNAPVAANSATLVNSIGAATSVHADFGTVYAGALNGTNIRMISQGASLLNLSLVVAEADLAGAVGNLHREFFSKLDENVFEAASA